MPQDTTPTLVEQLRSDLKEQPEYCLRPHQRMEYEEEAARLKTVVDAPDWQAGSAKVMARERYKKVLQTLQSQAPRAIDEPLRRDRVARLSQEVLDTVIKPAMLTLTEMRRNPAGAVGEFLRRENSPEVQTAIRSSLGPVVATLQKQLTGLTG